MRQRLYGGSPSIVSTSIPFQRWGAVAGPAEVREALVSAAAVPSLGQGEAVYYAFNDLSDWKGREYTNPADIFASTLSSH